RLASVSGNKGKVWDLRTGKEALALQGGLAGASHGTFSPDGKRLVTAGSGGLKVWDAQTGRELLSLDQPAELGLPFTPDCSFLSCATRVQDGIEVRMLDGTPLNR